MEDAASSRIGAIVEGELRNMPPDIAVKIRPFLVAPCRTVRPWSYGPELHEGWMMVEDDRTDTGIGFFPAGIGPGPRKPQWILLFIKRHLDIGMDSAWFFSLRDAFQDSFMWEDGS